MRWLIDCYNPEGKFFADIPWDAPTADEAVKEFTKKNPEARLDCIKPGNYVPQYRQGYQVTCDESKFIPEGMMERFAKQLKENQEERMRDIFGIPKFDLQEHSVSVKLTPEALERCRENMRSFGSMMGTPIYTDDIEEDADVYTEVGRFFKRKG